MTNQRMPRRNEQWQCVKKIYYFCQCSLTSEKERMNERQNMEKKDSCKYEYNWFGISSTKTNKINKKKLKNNQQLEH